MRHFRIQDLLTTSPTNPSPDTFPSGSDSERKSSIGSTKAARVFSEDMKAKMYTRRRVVRSTLASLQFGFNGLSGSAGLLDCSLETLWRHTEVFTPVLDLVSSCTLMRDASSGPVFVLSSAISYYCAPGRGFHPVTFRFATVQEFAIASGFVAVPTTDSNNRCHRLSDFSSS